MKKISVIIPLFNKEAYIARALQSVLSQTVPPFEIIVVDDGSTDTSNQIASQFDDSRITILYQGNSGVSSARNHGVEAACGELVAFLDADDTWRPIFLETIVKLVESYPECGAYMTNYDIVMNSGTRLPELKGLPSFPWEGLIPRYFFVAASGEPPITASSCCIPKNILMDTGGFLPGKRMGEDIDLWGRIALKYPLVFSSVVAASYHHDAENRACTTFDRNDEHPFCQTVSELLCLNEIDPALIDDVDMYVSRLKVENMRQHVLAGNFRRARELNNEVKKACFGFRRFLWGSYFNFLASFAWHIWYDRSKHA